MANMIETFRDGFRNPEIRKKMLYTIMIIILFRVGGNIPVPGIDRVAFTNLIERFGQLGSMMDIMSGGALKTVSIFAMGITPYINASIIIQLLSMDIIPYLSDLAKSGQQGQMQMDKITRYLAVVLGYVQSITLMNLYKDVLVDTSWSSLFYMGTIMIAGTMFLLWLGDQITSKGVGNGISLIIMAGIISRMPVTYKMAFDSMITANGNSLKGILFFALYVLVNIAIVVLVIFMNQAVRKITIQYSSSSGATRGRNMNHLPLKINSASVVPVIFAGAIIQAPIIALSYINQQSSVFKFLQTYLT